MCFNEMLLYLERYVRVKSKNVYLAYKKKSKKFGFLTD